MIQPLELKLVRKWFTERSTVGTLYTNDKFFCYTLEDRVRPANEKIKGRTAIPWGTYPVKVTFSDRFQKPLPLVIGVPNFVGVRIHAGNKPEDTEGCILVGLTHSADWVGHSGAAMDALMDILNEAHEAQRDVRLEIFAGGAENE